jgi:hypothetical protein
VPYRTVAKIAGSHSRLERRLLRRLQLFSIARDTLP